MKKNQLTFVVFFLFTYIITAQNLKLNAFTIPDSLKTNANAVFRYDHTDIDIIDAFKMIIHKQAAITVLNKYGDDDGYIQLAYDNHRKIKNVNARIFDGFGNEIKKIRESDFSDVSAVDDGSLFTDNRVLYYEHHSTSYPYTIVYEYEVSTSNTAFIPSWYPVNFFQASTEHSTYKLSYPDDITIVAKEFNTEGYAIENNSREGMLSYTIKAAPAIKYEVYSPDFSRYGPHIKFASNKFQIGGTYGEANNWDEFGKWWYDNLIKDRDELSEKTENEINELVKNVSDPKEKAKMIYQYMQNRTRYISVQIGIGGWKPMEAIEVDKLGYGDCKALTNYTKALLTTAGIPSYYSKIYAGSGQRKKLDPDIATQQSNHVILMVPFEKDTVWLECTSQKAPFGYLGSFTDDRDALVVTPEGGKIIRTKKYELEENRQDIKGELSLDNDGNISAKINIMSSGIQYDNHYGIESLNEEDKNTYYKSFFDEISNVDLKKIDVKSHDDKVIFEENIEFTAENFAVNSGEKILVRLNFINISENIPKRIRNRKLPLEIPYGFIDTDDVIINLPSDYTIEAMGNPSKLDTKFGSYSIEIEQLNEKQLKYKRTLKVKQGLYSMNDYDAYRKFKKKINQLDNLKIVLTKIL